MKTGEQYKYQQRDCDQCGKMFEAAYSHARYCSGKCRTAASRAKSKGDDMLSDGYRAIWRRVSDVSPDAIASLRDLYDRGDKDALRSALRCAKSLLMDLGYWEVD